MALTQEQLQARKIGGSDVATILGLNPYKTALELYHEKRGTLDRPDLSENFAVEAGNVLEDGIAALAASKMTRKWGREVKLRRSNLTLVNPKYEWLTIHIDRDVVGEDRGVECKNVGSRAAKHWGEEGSDEIPDYYLPQPHAYMLVKDYPVWTVAAYFGGDDLRLFEIESSKDWRELIVEATHDFWFYQVLKGVPPPLDLDAPRAQQVLQRVYPGTDGTIVPGDADAEHWFYVLLEAKRKVDAYESVASAAKAHLLDKMKEAAVLELNNGGKLTRKRVTRKGYTVADTEYVEARITKPKGE
jgi:putative phage-type endonuclease